MAFDDREKNLKSKDDIIKPKKEPGKCKHAESWHVKCMECGFEFDWSPKQAQLDAVELEFKAHREVAQILLYEMDDNLRNKGVSEHIRQPIYEHNRNAAIMLKFVHDKDLETWEERRKHSI